MRKILILTLFCCITTSTQHYNKIDNHYKSNTNESTISFLNEELNDSILYLALLHYKVKYPKIVLAQAKLESGNFTSYHCDVNNNFLGLYNSKKGKYFKFNHWTDCLLKYKQCFQSKDLNYSTDEEYIDYLLEIGYATDPLYKDKIMRIISNLEYGKEKISI